MPVKILDNITVIECATFVTGPVGFDNIVKAAAPPPLVGEQSEKILRELGHDAAAIDDLLAHGVSLIAR